MSGGLMGQPGVSRHHILQGSRSLIMDIIIDNFGILIKYVKQFYTGGA